MKAQNHFIILLYDFPLRFLPKDLIEILIVKNIDMTTIKTKNYPIEYAYSIAIENIASLLQANQQNGLGEDEVDKRIALYGLNSYKEQKKKVFFYYL